MYTIKTLKSLNRVDFDAFYAANEAEYEAVFPWPSEVTDKKEFIKSLFGMNMRLPHVRAYIGKEVRGDHVVIGKGEIDAEGFMTLVIVLLRPNKAGSRSWIYDPQFNSALNKWVKEQGCVGIAIENFKSGTVERNYMRQQYLENSSLDVVENKETSAATNTIRARFK